MYKIDKVGNVYECNIDLDDLNKYLDDLKKSLTENYYNLESICKAEADYSPMYTTVFMGSTISVPLELIEETYVGTILIINIMKNYILTIIFEYIIL